MGGIIFVSGKSNMVGYEKFWCLEEYYRIDFEKAVDSGFSDVGSSLILQIVLRNCLYRKGWVPGPEK